MTTQKTDPATQGNSPAGGAPNPGQGSGEPRTFTQDDVNRLMGQTRAEERGKYADYEALKTKAAQFDEHQKAAMTEADRIKAERDQYKTAAEQAEQRATQTAIAAEIRVRAAAKGIIDPDAALALVDRAGIVLKDGKVDGVDTALDALVTAKPYLKGQAGAPNINGSGGQTAPKAVTLTPEQKLAARYLFSSLTPDKAEEAYMKGLKQTS